MPSRTQERAGQSRPQEERGVVVFDAKTRMAEIEASLTARREQFIALLGGDPKLADRFLTVVLDTVVRSRDLLEAEPLSLLTAIRTAGTLGLEPTGVLGDGAIIARRDRNQGGKKIAQFQPMYRGLMRLARSSGQVASMDAAIVYENDVEFEILRGTEPVIRHVPTLDDDQGSVKGAYAFARLTSGELVVRYWPVAKLLRHRDRFAKDSKFWSEHPEPMMMKTVIHDLMKYLPLGHTASLAMAVDESVDYGAPAPVVSRSAKRLGAGEDGPQDEQEPEAGKDTAPTGDGAPEGSSEPTDDADVCEATDEEFGDCIRTAHGPEVTHRNDDGETWA